MSLPENWCPTKPVQPRDDCRSIEISALCQLGWQPILMTGMLRDVMIRKFSQPFSIETVDLRRYVWTDNEETGILIESVYRWRGDVVEKRPAVLIKRNALQGMTLMLNDLAGTDEKGFAYDNHTVMWVGSHTLFCIHGTGASVELLATEVQRHITRFAPAIRQNLGLAKFQVTEIGAISEIEEAKERYVVPVTIGWAYQENWQLRLEALPLKRIPLNTLVRWQALDSGDLPV